MSDSATLWTVAHQAPLSMGLSRKEYWSGLLGPPLGDPSHPGIEPVSLMSPEQAGMLFATSATWKAQSKQQSSREALMKTGYTHLRQNPVKDSLTQSKISAKTPDNSGFTLFLPGPLQHLPGLRQISGCVYGGLTI